MSTHNAVSLDALSDKEILELAKFAREFWRQEVAAGRMQFDPKRMRAYDKEVAELGQLIGA